MVGIAIAMSANVANAQYWNSTNGNRLEALTSTNEKTVHVGIGVAPSDTKVLNVKGTSWFEGTTTVKAPGSFFHVVTTNNSGIRLQNSNGLNNIESRIQSTNAPLGFIASSFSFALGDVNIAKNLNVTGKITCHNQIEVTAMNAGTMNAGSINADGINAKDIKVELPAAADYVFEDNYNLKSLSEVESYVKENKHLPGMPSASEFAEKGMSVSEMSNKLLEKVEELTLHLIQLEKENASLKAQMEVINNKVK